MRQSQIVATPEEFLYMKSVFVIKDAELTESGSIAWFSGSIYGMRVMTDLFPKGKYTL